MGYKRDAERDIMILEKRYMIKQLESNLNYMNVQSIADISLFYLFYHFRIDHHRNLHISLLGVNIVARLIARVTATRNAKRDCSMSFSRAIFPW